MKVKMTEIECTAEEIKASNSLAEGVLNALIMMNLIMK